MDVTAADARMSKVSINMYILIIQHELGCQRGTGNQPSARRSRFGICNAIFLKPTPSNASIFHITPTPTPPPQENAPDDQPPFSHRTGAHRCCNSLSPACLPPLPASAVLALSRTHPPICRTFNWKHGRPASDRQQETRPGIVNAPISQQQQHQQHPCG